MLSDDEPAKEVIVRVLGQDTAGNSSWLGYKVTEADGRFEFPGIPAEKNPQVTLYAHAKPSFDNDFQGQNGEATVLLGDSRDFRYLQLIHVGWWGALFLLPPIFFVGSIYRATTFDPKAKGYEPSLLPNHPTWWDHLKAWLRNGWRRLGHYTAGHLGVVWLTLAVAVTMILAILVAFAAITSQFRTGVYATLGFATLFEGTYVQNQGPEPLFSLTAPARRDGKAVPTPAAGSKTTTRPDGKPAASDKSATSLDDKLPADATPVVIGFGAPFWVIQVSIIGAALFAVASIIQGISDVSAAENETTDETKRKTEENKRMRAMIQNLVVQQFAILFSPLGGIFVYQALVLASAASQPWATAVAVLGAGTTLNVLLPKAAFSAAQWLQSKGKE